MRELKDVPVGGVARPARAGMPPSARFLGGNLSVTGLADAASGDLCDWRGRRVSRLERVGNGLFAVRGGVTRPGVYIATIRSPSGAHRFRVYRD